MSEPAPLRLLLGPQRPDVNLDRALTDAGLGEEPIGVISAAWQEAEGDIDDIRRLVTSPLFDLGVYQRAETLFAADAGLNDAYRHRQDALKEQQRLYRLRLKQLMIAARAILRAEGDQSVLAEERRHAIAQLRALDRHHLHQVAKIRAHFEAEFNPRNYPPLSAEAEALANDLARCSTVLITGGNVVVLINRLRLFGLDRQLREKNIVAWSAGAMVLCDRIVLFHDRMPQGRRDPEIMCDGLGIVPGIVVLPDGRRRLRTSETVRMRLFSGRFSPATCITLDNGSTLLLRGETLSQSDGARRMTRDGKFVRVRTR